MDFFEFVASRQEQIYELTLQHFLLVMQSVLISTVIAVLLGIAVYRRGAVRNVSLLTASVLLTIPSFAFIVFMATVLGFGRTAVVVVLVAYGLLPVLRNTVVGLQGVDPALVDAGRGMGMSGKRLMLRVQLPLAWPVVLAGIRVSTQLLMGIAAIGAYVQGGGLGDFIFSGIARFGAVNSVNQALTGTIMVVILALVVDLAYLAVARVTTSRGIRA